MTSTSATPTRYALVGTGWRSEMYSTALFSGRYPAHRLVALSDINPGRAAFANREYGEKFKAAPLPIYAPADLEKMIKEQRIDRVIVTTIDRTHHDYIVRSLEAGCDVVVEKPLTIDEAKCRAIHQAIKRTGRRVIVTFNYRYAPRNSKLREILAAGTIGDVLSVHFEWTLDTCHGADYFRRWHRDIRNSGGLMVHKASHHFDLVNWWLGSQPETVFGFGNLAFYGKANAEARGLYKPYERATGSEAAKSDPFALQMKEGERSRGMYYDNEQYDAYRRDQNVFGDGISIQDDMGVLVRYRNGATMSYHLTAYSPWEGYRVMFNGSKGRLEIVYEESRFVNGAEDPRMSVLGAEPAGTQECERRIMVRPLWQKPYEVSLGENPADGGHGGGDQRLLDDLFIGAGDDPLKRAADHMDGTWAILTGVAANKSFATGQAVRIDDLMTGY